jgi:hypothetical protein
MKTKFDVIYTFQSGPGGCLLGSRHFLQSAIPAATLAATFPNMERRVWLCLQVDVNQSSVTHLTQH